MTCSVVIDDAAGLSWCWSVRGKRLAGLVGSLSTSERIRYTVIFSMVHSRIQFCKLIPNQCSILVEQSSQSEAMVWLSSLPISSKWFTSPRSLETFASLRSSALAGLNLKRVQIIQTSKMRIPSCAKAPPPQSEPLVLSFFPQVHIGTND